MLYQRIALLCLSLLAMPLHADNETSLAVWANEAIVATYTYNYQNFLTRQKEIAPYFTSDGWINYSKALNEAQLPTVVQKNNFFVSAVATLPPQIKVIRENHWLAIMPLLVLYKNQERQQKQTLEVSLEFTTAPSGQGIRGLAITSLQAKQVSPICECPSDKVN